jgi:hypothetical protein
MKQATPERCQILRACLLYARSGWNASGPVVAVYPGTIAVSYQFLLPQQDAWFIEFPTTVG